MKLVICFLVNFMVIRRKSLEADRNGSVGWTREEKARNCRQAIRF